MYKHRYLKQLSTNRVFFLSRSQVVEQRYYCLNFLKEPPFGSVASFSHIDRYRLLHYQIVLRHASLINPASFLQSASQWFRFVKNRLYAAQSGLSGGLVQMRASSKGRRSGTIRSIAPPIFYIPPFMVFTHFVALRFFAVKYINLAFHPLSSQSTSHKTNRLNRSFSFSAN